MTKLKEKMLLIDINNKKLKQLVILPTEKITLEVEPYGNFWTMEYLNQLVDLYQKIDKNKKNQKLESLFMVYFDSSDKGFDINNIKVKSEISYCKLNEITKVKGKNKFLLSIECKDVHLIDNSSIMTMNDSKAKNIYNDAAYCTSLDVKNYLPFTEEEITDPNFSTMDYMTNNMSALEEAITVLVESHLWPKCVKYRLIQSGMKYTSEEWINTVLTASADNTDGFENPGAIVVPLALYSVAGNRERYEIISSKSIIEQLNIVKKILEGFYNLTDFTPKEKAIFSKIKLYKSFSKKSANKKTDVSNEIKKLNKSDKSKETKDYIYENILEDEINKKVKNNLERQQKEFLLLEKMKAIKESLNETSPESDSDDEVFSKLLSNKKTKMIFPDSVLKLITSEKDRLKSMMSGTPDANITQAYLNVLKQLPWRKVEIETLDIKKAREVLDKNHYGLKEVKERIIEYLSLIINHKNTILNGKDSSLINLDKNHQIDMNLFKEDSQGAKVQKEYNNVPILTLVGPPGTGKTSLARAIAEALNKSYIKISLGGVHDESEIRGHRRTYVGAMPGKIIKAIQRANVSNPLILLDEIDKMSSDFKGDPSSAMLEVLDPEQNTKFQDNYLEHEYDLSKVMFIATANYYENIPAPLLDRVEIIELNSYTINEKIKIAKEHLIDATTRQASITPKQFQIDDETIEFIIKFYTAEAGVRGLKRCFDKIARKIVTRIVAGEKLDEFVINKHNIQDLLGTPKFSEDMQNKEPQIGVVNGLAYTSIGGTTLQIEVSPFASKSGGIKLTGSLKDVMKESANIALTYVRSNAEKFGIDFDFDSHEIHVHVPEGAVPKDGPSAGVTFTTALISALSNKPVPQDIAMTGEITLRGRVLEIGGLKEKSFAAFKKGVKTVFIPKNNEKNLKDIPHEVKDAITFVPVEKYEQIYDKLFK
ncbi:endopeptidase La [Mycoplasmopsis lipofaciens]|uniref:endopeptidase La n=1 Tax=Mycoplasmopsis lipofaciens TaxID=114884 RepID=UPI0009FFDF6A|nr:endopeptidase La [Mycoplasmopsis lipofaciens]